LTAETTGTPRAYGKGSRMLTLDELCDWLNITQRHARKLVERDAIPYRKVGHLLRFPEAEVEEWSRPSHRPIPLPTTTKPKPGNNPQPKKHVRSAVRLPKSLIE
jgi:excisionase family DNA binding protein